MPSVQTDKTVLLVGASRGLGLAMAEEYLKRGYHVIATARHSLPESFARLTEHYPDTFEAEQVDITFPRQIDALYEKLRLRTLHTLFVNAGVKNADHETVADVSTEEFIRVMVTNALSPMRVIEKFQDRVVASGTIGVMSSGQGSITNNTRPQFEIYRSSKAALNMFMRSFAARHSDNTRTLLLMAPGWVKTDMGGANAQLTIEESIPSLVNTMESYAGRQGLHYLDYRGRTVPW